MLKKGLRVLNEVLEIENVDYDKELPVVDREQIVMLSMSEDPEEIAVLAGELFELFFTEAEEKMADLAQACSELDAPRFRKIVHFIAGSAGNLGVLRLASLLRGIEHAIDDGSLSDLVGCEAIVREQFGYSCRAFKSEFGL